MPMPIGTGWAAKQPAAKARMAAREGGAHPVADNAANRERQEMILAKQAADRAHAEAVERQRAVTVIDCPCCSGKGHVLLNRGAAMVEALDRYDFVGWKADSSTIAKLLPLAFDVDSTGQRITAPVVQAVQNAFAAQAKLAEAQTDAEAVAEIEAVETPKKPRRIVPPPHLEG